MNKIRIKSITFVTIWWKTSWTSYTSLLTYKRHVNLHAFNINDCHFQNQLHLESSVLDFSAVLSLILIPFVIRSIPFLLQAVWRNELSSTWRRCGGYQNDTLRIPYMVKSQREKFACFLIPTETFVLGNLRAFQDSSKMRSLMFLLCLFLWNCSGYSNICSLLCYS